MGWRQLVESHFPTASKEAVDEVTKILEEGGPAALLLAREDEILSAEAEEMAGKGLKLNPFPCGWDCCGADLAITEFCGETRWWM